MFLSASSVFNLILYVDFAVMASSLLNGPSDDVGPDDDYINLHCLHERFCFVLGFICTFYPKTHSVLQLKTHFCAE